MTYDEYTNILIDSLDIWVTTSSNLSYLADLSEKYGDSIDIEFPDAVYNAVIEKARNLGVYRGYIENICRGNSNAEIIFSVICSDLGNEAGVTMSIDELLDISYIHGTSSFATLYVPSEIYCDVIEGTINNGFRG